MKLSIGSLALGAQLFFGTSMAQKPLDVGGTKLTTYTPSSGNPGLTVGYSFPSTPSKNEFVGHIAGSGPGYIGISIGGGMLNRLLLLAWSDGSKVHTSLRYAGGYTRPAIYNGTAEVKDLASSVDGKNFQITYRCTGCLSWDFAGRKGSVDLGQDSVKMGWAQSAVAPTAPTDPKSGITFHNLGQGVLSVNKKDVASYA